MQQKIQSVLVFLCLAVLMGGCVAKSDYLKKEGEAQTLAGDLQSLQRKHDALLKENEQLMRDLAAAQEEKEQKVEEVSSTYESLLARMKDEVARGEVTISELKGRLTVNMVDSILFDSGKAEVKPKGLEVLNKVVDVLKDVHDKTILIEGHTDDVQITGALAARYPTNWELSAARAINVTKYLQEKGIDPALLTAEAHGEFSPVADNATEEGKAKNRRIEIILVARN